MGFSEDVAQGLARASAARAVPQQEQIADALDLDPSQLGATSRASGD
jgi:hypothetical protein